MDAINETEITSDPPGSTMGVREEGVQVTAGFAAEGVDVKRITANRIRPPPRRSGIHKRRCVFRNVVMVIEFVARTTGFSMRQ